MPPSHVSFDFREIDHGIAYDIMAATIHPRPIAFVSSISAAGELNLAPFSFFMVGGSNPPSLAFSPNLTKFGPKDSLRFVEETGEFVVNLVHRQIAEAMNLTAKGYPPEISEWDVGGVTPMPSVVVKPPRVAESLVQFECKLFKVVAHGDEVGAARYVIGEIVYAHLATNLWSDEGGVVHERVRPIARMGGPHYLDTDALEFFTMERPS